MSNGTDELDLVAFRLDADCVHEWGEDVLADDIRKAADLIEVLKAENKTLSGKYEQVDGVEMALGIVMNRVSELEAERDELLERQRWIPVSERLPEHDGAFQVVRRENEYPTTRVWTGHRWASTATVTHWRYIDPPEDSNE